MANRISGLERLLTQQIQNPPSANIAQVVDRIDPMDTLKNTVKTIEQLEQIKGAMGISDRDREPQSDASIYTELIKGFMEMELEKRRAQVAQLQAQSHSPQLPPSVPVQQPAPAAPAGQRAQTAPQFDPLTGQQIDPAIITQAMSHIENLPRSERLKLASAVLGEPIDDGEDEWIDDPPEMENQNEAGQIPIEDIGLSYSDETGKDQGSDPPCSDPSIQGPPVPPSSES